MSISQYFVEADKLYQVRINLELLYGNSDFEFYKPLIKNTLDILDELIDVDILDELIDVEKEGIT